MKTKLEMAHEYAIALINSDSEMQFDKFIRLCWNYADAMQAEADKREPSGFPNVLRGACGEIVAVKVDDKEWQHDWAKKTNDELRMLVKTLDGIIESRSDCNHEWDHISAYGGSGNYYVCSCGAEKHPVDDF